MITIIDYGCGNINAFVNAFKRLNIASKVAKTKKDIVYAQKLILPGVGAFDHVMQSFNDSGMREIVEKKVLDEKVHVLGICAGMQIFADSSEEGKLKGLGWIDGVVRLFDTKKINHRTKLPHMGWNTITHNNSILFNDLCNGSRFYFVHSYFFDNTKIENAIATTEYGVQFTSSINKGNVFGVQFHPEKSHHAGVQLLKNFSAL